MKLLEGNIKEHFRTLTGAGLFFILDSKIQTTKTKIDDVMANLSCQLDWI